MTARCCPARLCSRDAGRPPPPPPLLLALLLLAAAAAPARAFLRPNETDCPAEALVELGAGLERPDGSFELGGLRYPARAVRWQAGRPLGCPCLLRGCLPLCCEPRTGCVRRLEDGSGLEPLFEPESLLPLRGLGVRDLWQFSWDPCHGGERYALEPESRSSANSHDKFFLLSNGSLYQPTLGLMRDHNNYCVGLVNGSHRVTLCFDEPDLPDASGSTFEGPNKAFPWGMLISELFLGATFLVYLLLPELRNLPGQCLCSYVFCLINAYAFLAYLQLWEPDRMSDLVCLALAYIVHFSFLASFFWLNVMCFDIWWTFGGFRSLHGSVKQRERKKFIMYSIYAWGCASILTSVCMIMDLVPGIPNDIIKPGFGIGSCWFNTNIARAIYFYGPMGVTVLCNICLFIITAVKISRHQKDTARQLKGSDSKRHDDNKQWFNLYLKLFVVMGINWSMEIISWIYADSLLKYLWYITDLTNTLQGVIIFLIFVWKDKIKRLLLRRFGFENGKWVSRNSTTRNGCPTSSMASRATCVTTSAPLQEKPSFAPDAGCRGKTNAVCTDTESDCV